MVVQIETFNSPVNGGGTQLGIPPVSASAGISYQIVSWQEFRVRGLVSTSGSVSACPQPRLRDVLRATPSLRTAFIAEAVASLAFEGVRVLLGDANRWLDEVLDEPPLGVTDLTE